MPYAAEKTDAHTWRVESRKADAMPWFIDCYGGEKPVWFTLAGGETRIEELEARGIAARDSKVIIPVHITDFGD